MGPRPARARRGRRARLVRRPDDPRLHRRPDLRPVRGPAGDHRRARRAHPDHRPDHLGGSGGPARADRRPRSRRSPRCSCTSRSSSSRTTSSSRRSRATRSTSTRARSSPRSSSAGRSSGCSGRSSRCRSRRRSATSSSTSSGGRARSAAPSRAADRSTAAEIAAMEAAGGRFAVEAGAERGPMTDPRDPDFDPYKVLQIDPEADHEIIQVVYRRLARKYHPDVTPGPEAAANGCSSSTPRWRSWATRAPGGVRPGAGAPRAALGARSGDPARRSPVRAGPARAPGGGSGADAGRGAEPDRVRLGVGGHAQTADRLARLDERPVDGRRRLRPDPDADGRRRGGRRAATRQSVGDRAQLRPLRGLVARARSPGPTSSTSNGSTGWRSVGPTATRSTDSSGRPVGDGAPRSTTTDGVCSGGADGSGPEAQVRRAATHAGRIVHEAQSGPALHHSARVCRMLMLWRIAEPDRDADQRRAAVGDERERDAR